MRFYTTQHKASGGIALHARSMDRCLLSQDGVLWLHRPMQTRPERFLKAIAPSREALVVGVACLFTWDGLAALGARAGMPCVRGPARSLQALHGGTAHNEQIDAQKIAGLRRGGRLPPADVSPAAMRAPRALRRWRTPWRRQRAAVLTPLPQTTRQDPLPERGTQIADTANRDGGAERLPAPAVPQRIDGARALMGHDDQRRRDGERSRRKTAQQPHAQTRSRLRTGPGIGALLRGGLLSAIHAIPRFPRGQAFLSSCRRVKGTQESAAKREGTSGTQSGHAPLQGAGSEAAVRLLRAPPAGQKSLPTREKQHGSGHALPLVGPQRGRTVYDRFPRPTACEMDTLLHGARERRGGAGRRTGPPRAQPVERALSCRGRGVRERGGAQRPVCPAPVAVDGTSAPALVARREACRVDVCCPSPAPATHWRTAPVQPSRCRGRYAGTARGLGRRDAPEPSRHASSPRREHRKTGVVQPRRCACKRQCRQHTWPEADDTSPEPQRKPWEKAALRGRLSLDNRGPHKGWARV